MVLPMRVKHMMNHIWPETLTNQLTYIVLFQVERESQQIDRVENYVFLFVFNFVILKQNIRQTKLSKEKPSSG